ncbi:MAG: hypothetical protein ACC628_14120 [Pirellulaceae bacterium]
MFIVLMASLSLAIGNRVARAEETTVVSDSVPRDLVDQIHGLEKEVQTLRSWQNSMINRLAVTEASLRRDYDGWDGDSDGFGACASCDASDCCDTCERNCHSYPCECPLPEAPCIECPRVSTLNPYFNVRVFGALKLDMLFNGARPISPGTPFYLTPGGVAGFDENTFDMNARQSMLGAALTGPQIGNFQSGGTVLAMFYNDAVLVDQYGFLPLQAFGELRNDDWRFAAGLQFDVFSPGAPTVLPFSALAASGNAGNSFRGQVRVERFLQPADDVQWTLQFALSEPITSTIDPAFRLLEDNGWPNVEGRVALALGSVEGVGAAAQRPFELGVSGVAGEIRTTIPATDQIVADVWGLGMDFRWRINDFFGFAGEIFTGESLGTYNAGILQNVNSVTFEGIRSTGGWFEAYAYLTPGLHSHLGYGVDDPRNADVAATGRIRNETYFANLIWDVNSTFRIAAEATWRDTTYNTLRDNEGAGFHTQFQWAF